MAEPEMRQVVWCSLCEWAVPVGVVDSTAPEWWWQSLGILHAMLRHPRDYTDATGHEVEGRLAVYEKALGVWFGFMCEVAVADLAWVDG